MKTFKNDIIQIERYLSGELSAPEWQEFKAKLLHNSSLRLKVYFQKKVHLLLKLYHRKQVKAELEMLHQELMRNPVKAQFQHRIRQIFQ